MIDVNKNLIQADLLCDYIPFVSTASNFINLFQKVVICFNSHREIFQNRYWSYIDQKNILRSIVLLIPFLGNIVIGIYDFVNEQGVFNFIRKPIKGFVFEIRNNDEVRGYLFGSQHSLPEEAKLHPRMQQAIDKCRKVYLEVVIGSEAIKAGIGLDHRIARNREVFGLEKYTSRDDVYFAFAQRIHSAKYNGVDPSLKAFWNRDEKALQQVLKKYNSIASDEIHQLVFQRTRNWVPVMSRELNAAQEPIAIVVGALHLFDVDSNKGCITLLKEAGFSVTSY